jgi:hypothetical protein
MTLVSVRAYDGEEDLAEITAADNVTLRRLTLPGVTYRSVEVEYDDVPGTTVVQSVKATQMVSFEVGVSDTDMGTSLDTLDEITDAICDPELRSWSLEFTYDSGRVETWTALRPADCSSRDHEHAIVPLVVTTFSVPVHPVAAIGAPEDD